MPGCNEKWNEEGESLESQCAPPGLPFMQAFFGHMEAYLCALHREYSVFDLVRHLLYSDG